MPINTLDVMNQSPLGFGTSGARGLVSDMTDEVCFAYALAFLAYLEQSGQFERGGRVAIAGDFRPSSPRIMHVLQAAVIFHGGQPVSCGYIASPAVAYFGLLEKIPSMMVTGSHIPDDRNGIKFNTSQGEILKIDEEGIRSQSIDYDASWFRDGKLVKDITDIDIDNSAYQAYIERFTGFFDSDALTGFKVGLYEHSTVTRGAMYDVFTALGADVLKLGFSEKFIPVDTEAIRVEDIVLAKQWVEEYQLDCIVSADGDGDRPLISNEYGEFFRGDVAGVLTAMFLHADNVVTPVSSNTMVESCHQFKQVGRTRIGSPFVVKAMQEISDKNAGVTVGYEANGGFLQHSDIIKNGKTLKALPTRDAMIVPLCVMLLAKEEKVSLSTVLNNMPARFTESDRIKNFPTESSNQLLAGFTQGSVTENTTAIEHVFGEISGRVSNIDLTDGVRIVFDNKEIIHLRPSGNAPELRCYCEANTQHRVQELLASSMQKIAGLV